MYYIIAYILGSLETIIRWTGNNYLKNYIFYSVSSTVKWTGNKCSYFFIFYFYNSTYPHTIFFLQYPPYQILEPIVSFAKVPKYYIVWTNHMPSVINTISHTISTTDTLIFFHTHSCMIFNVRE